MTKVDISGEKSLFLDVQESSEFYFSNESNSEVKLIIRSIGQCELNFYFKENNAVSDVKILFLCDQDLKAKARIFFSGINNQVRLDVRGIARGNAKVFFDAGVDIASHAEQTDVYISEKGVIFDKAKINFFPNLQIAQNNVKAGHAASVKNYREDDLFYLFSRGLNESEAKNLLLEGFLGDFSEYIQIQEILPHAQR